MKEALFYTQLEKGVAGCELCPHRCRIAPGKRGICKVRENLDGVLYARTYGRISSLALDPIEKKPLYHFFPGREILSIGSYGCNFFCLFCQNWQISQNEVETWESTPEELVTSALEHNSLGIAYTYNEPLVNYEFVLATAKLAREKGLKNVLVSNGYVNSQPLEELLEYFDAVNFDIKAGSNDFYSALCGGNIKPVLASARTAAAAGVHLELTTLLIPGENDDPAELAWLAEWIAENCGKSTVVHLSAYFPRYKFDTDPTSEEDLIGAWEIFTRYLDYVYCGNMTLAARYSNTYCQQCGSLLVGRSGYRIDISGIEPAAGVCSACGAEVDFCL